MFSPSCGSLLDINPENPEPVWAGWALSLLGRPSTHGGPESWLPAWPLGPLIYNNVALTEVEKSASAHVKVLFPSCWPRSSRCSHCSPAASHTGAISG